MRGCTSKGVQAQRRSPEDDGLRDRRAKQLGTYRASDPRFPCLSGASSAAFHAIRSTAYRSDLLQFGEFLDSYGLDVMGAQHGDLAAFLSKLAAGSGGRAPVAAATLHRKTASLRSFYRHLRLEGVIEHDPTAELRGPHKTQRLPKVLTREEVAKLLSGPKGGEPHVLRDRALLEVMYACGLRASEVVGLQVEDVGYG